MLIIMGKENTEYIAERIAVIYDEQQRAKQEEERRLALWRAFDRKLIPYERRFISKMRGFFRQQKAEVLANMRAKSIKDISDWLFDVRKYEILFEEFGQLLLPEVVSARGQEELERLIVGVAFDVTNPRVQEFLDEKVFKFSFETNATTIKHLRREFAAGLTDGEGIPVLAKRVEKVFGFAEKQRSVRIARTEVLSCSNRGAHAAYRQSGVVRKEEWLATKDDRVRDSHAAIDGEVVLIQDKFSNGLQYPGDASGRPEEIINCRCALVPVVEE